MGSIFKYSGLTTKVRAMRGGLIKREQYAKIAGLGSVGEMVELLKNTRGYGDIFKDVEPSDIHRGNMEKLMLCAKYHDYEKLYRFANMRQRRYMRIHFLQYETDILKQAIVHAFNHGEAEVVVGFGEILGKYSEIDIKAVCEATNVDDIIEASRDTIFFDTLQMVRAFNEPTEFDYGIALDLFFFSYVWKKRKKLFEGDELKAVSMNIGTEADILNIMWIHRTKRYYHLSPEKIYAMIIPVHYRLKKAHIKKMVEAENEAAFISELSETYYGKLVDKNSFDSGNVGALFEEHLTRCYHMLFKMDPYSLAAINAYLNDKEVEIKKLITMAECIRYQYPIEEIIRDINLK